MKGFLFKRSVLVLILCFVTSVVLAKSVGTSESVLHCKRFEFNQKKASLVHFSRGCMQCHHAEPAASSRPLSKVQDNFLIDLHDVIKGML
ncbi:MAG: hypothetical protein K0U37_09825 [Gammaproteobacteria bacterium]|nr:hypothetical protein [Gammaproteobacteria bacterium]